MSEEGRRTARCCSSDRVPEGSPGREHCYARGCEGLAYDEEAFDEAQGSWSEDRGTCDRLRVTKQVGEASCDRRLESLDEVVECHQDPWGNEWVGRACGEEVVLGEVVQYGA